MKISSLVTWIRFGRSREAIGTLIDAALVSVRERPLINLPPERILGHGNEDQPHRMDNEQTMTEAAERDIYEIGERPPVGQIPKYMHAQVIRQDRFGEPNQAFQIEQVEVPAIGPGEVLVCVMAAGVNYNNVWASLGSPIDVIGVRQRGGDPHDFHIGGSDASGIVYAVGEGVSNVAVGDQVVLHDCTWDPEDPYVAAGGEPTYSPSFRIWGYETNFGSFAQFIKVRAHQCLPKPPELTWEAAASYMLVAGTAYRMLLGWPEHTVREGDVVLVWGGSGGLGSLAIQITREWGGIPVAVVSNNERGQYCVELGAKGYVNRGDFDHWGVMPHWTDGQGYREWMTGARGFGAAIWEALGERKSPRIVIEHPGEDTIPTSAFVCDTGGMIAICAGTTGYNAVVDLRYHWVRQKRLQGSHGFNNEEAKAANDLIAEGRISPCLSRAFSFEEIPLAHQLMYRNEHPPGNMACLVGAPEAGLTNMP